MLAQGFLRVKGQAQITICYFFVSWRNKYAIIEWSLFDVPTSTHGVFTSFSLPQYCCLHFWKKKVGSMLAQGILRVKGQAKITKYYFLWVGAINMQSLSGHYFMPHFTPRGVFTSFSLSRCCCLHFCKNKFGLMLAQGYFKGQRSSIMHKLQLFMTVICNHRVVTTRCAIKYPWCLYFSVDLSAVAYISVEISLGSCWRRDILRVKGQGLITNCNFLWFRVICNHLVVTTRCAIKYPWCFYFF